MIGGDSLTRSIRLSKVQHLLHSHPRGLTTKELANLCGVTVRTIQRDLLCLQSDLGVPVTQHGDRYGILGNYVLPPISLSLCEAAALFLASRLVLRETDEYNPHIRSAITKVAAVLPSHLGSRLRNSIDSMADKPSDAHSMEVFEQVAVAWSTQRWLRIRYQSLRSEEVREWRLAPYFIEMTGAGYSTYVIGHGSREDTEGIRTFKLDRISEADILEESFDIPAGLDLKTLLGSSWGVMWGEETAVKLRFSPGVTRRVKESVWHPSQTIEDLSDGGCILTVVVASTIEITPWIRGWGPDVEVLEPVELREQFGSWAERLNQIYLGQ